MKGRTKWLPRKTNPVRNGEYECQAYFGGHVWLMMLTWDGSGFIVDFPMQVLHWRGLTKAEYLKESK